MTATIHDVVRSADGLRGYLITHARTGEIRRSWVRDKDALVLEDLAFGVARVLRAQEELVGMIGSGEIHEFATRADAGLIQSLVLDGGLLLIVICDADVALGMGRLFARRVAMAWTHERMDDASVLARSRAAMILDEVDDAVELSRAARIRVALRAGVRPDALDRPEEIDPEATRALEREAVALGFWDVLDGEGV